MFFSPDFLIFAQINIVHMEAKELISAFCDELRDLGVSPVVGDEFLSLEFQVEEIEPKQVSRLLSKYVGFWKSIGIKHNHSREEKIARFQIPLAWITGEDITNDQLLDIAGKISEKIGSLPQ